MDGVHLGLVPDHKAVGGATSKIGDPTGKDEARKSLTKEEIAQNAAECNSEGDHE